MGYGVDVRVVERARDLAGVHLRAEVGRSPSGRGRRYSEAGRLQGATADRRVAIDYLLGHNRTAQQQFNLLDEGEKAVARSAVLGALSEAGMLCPAMLPAEQQLGKSLKRRVLDRLFTEDERRTGKVSYIDPTTGQACAAQLTELYSFGI